KSRQEGGGRRVESGLPLENKIREGIQSVLVNRIRKTRQTTAREVGELPRLFPRRLETAIGPNEFEHFVKPHRAEAALFEHTRHLLRFFAPALGQKVDQRQRDLA